MIIARLHRGGLAESMETAKTFETLDEMKEWFSEQHHKAFSPDDVVIEENVRYDERISWHTQYVCTKRYGNEDYINKYGSPQCIGMCDLNH
jgi:hypothetical protein